MGQVILWYTMNVNRKEFVIIHDEWCVVVARFEVFTGVKIQVTVFWVVTLHGAITQKTMTWMCCSSCYDYELNKNILTFTFHFHPNIWYLNIFLSCILLMHRCVHNYIRDGLCWWKVRGQNGLSVPVKLEVKVNTFEWFSSVIQIKKPNVRQSDKLTAYSNVPRKNLILKIYPITRASPISVIATVFQQWWKSTLFWWWWCLFCFIFNIAFNIIL
jgi:hypothetical protein